MARGKAKLKVPIEPAAYLLQEGATSLGVSNAFIRMEIRRGRIKTIRRGKRLLVRREDFEAYLEPDEQPMKAQV
jgi:excisionase family DNA binding protein